MVDFKKAMAKKNASKGGDLRAALKPTSIKKLKKVVDEDNEMVGVQSNEYLNLEDGKTIKIRIFPGHPGEENFYVAKKCYWITYERNDGEQGRGTVLDSVVHGGTEKDICAEFIKFAKNKWKKDADKLECFSGQDSLSPQYTWLCYADKVVADEELRAKLWEFKKMVRDQMNKLAFSEDEDEPIEVDPFTDPDEGLPIMVKYMKKPNKKKGENYYETTFPKKVSPRPLTDEEIEYFMTLKPLSEVIPTYGMRDFERALEGLQNFDEEHELEMFEDEDWLAIVEEVKAQYDAEDDEEEEKPKKKTSKKVTSKKTSKKEEEEDEDDSDDEEEEEKPAKKSSKAAPKGKKKVEEPEDEEEDDDEEEESEEEETEAEDDGLDDMDRSELKKYIKEQGLEVSVKKSMSDDDLREAIREAMDDSDEEGEDETEEEDDEEEEKPKAKLTMKDIRSKLNGKK
jgi:hypothetical protein